MPASKSFSNSSKRILMGAVYIGVVVVIAAALVKAKDTQMVNKAKEIIGIYQADPGFKDPSTTSKLLSYHKQGLTLATGMLMSYEERNDALSARDALFMQAYETAPDIELASLLESHQALFDPGFRQEQLNLAIHSARTAQPAMQTGDVKAPQIAAHSASPPALVALTGTTPTQEVTAANEPNNPAIQPAETAPATDTTGTDPAPAALLPEAEGSTPEPVALADSELTSDHSTEVASTEPAPVGTEATIPNEEQASTPVEPPAPPAIPAISDKVRRATTTTLTVGQQAAVQACFTLLTERYKPEDKRSQVHLIVDGFLGSRSCN